MKFLPTLLITLLLVSPTVSHAAAHPRVVTILQELIRADTTNPPGNEVRAVRVIEKWLQQAPRIELKRFESAPGRMNLVARLPGHGTEAPLILLAHIDVVHAEASEWEVDPFAAIIRVIRMCQFLFHLVSFRLTPPLGCAQ